MSLSPPDPIGEIKWIVFGVVALAILGIVGYLGWSNTNLRSKLADDQTYIAQLQSANTDFQAKVDVANKAVEQLALIARDREAAAKQAVAAAENQAVLFENQAKLISNSTPSGNDCAAAKDLMKSYFKTAR